MDVKEKLRENAQWWALYIRLSREDGDKLESLSVAHQKMKLTSLVEQMEGGANYKLYTDDGWTGTNFERPEFQRMISDIENGNVVGVMVKDLSRLGRNSQKTTYYVQEFFPAHKVRFIAVDDNIDKQFYDTDTSEDMMIDVKNMFNGFYPRDISNKVRSTFRTKQKAGKFIGAFACYGYRKSPDDHNMLLVDEPAADIVRRIFTMYLSGYGQNTIAKKLNEEGVPCPTEYKKLQGMKYSNSRRLGSTTYWTYASIRNILRNECYTGVMVQNKTFRQVCKKKSMQMPREKWIVVPNTHEAIIDKDTFDKTQELLSQNTKPTRLTQNVHLFAGLIKCGDCGRAMCRVKRKGADAFCCGSYNRYGKKLCSAHLIQSEVLETLVLNDFNKILATLQDTKEVVMEEEKRYASQSERKKDELETLRCDIDRLERKKERVYEDYSEQLISKSDFIKYNSRYEEQIEALEGQISKIINVSDETVETSRNDWIKRLLEVGHVDKLDRMLVVEMVGHIYIYKNNTIKIIYNFSDDLKKVLEME